MNYIYNGLNNYFVNKMYTSSNYNLIVKQCTYISDINITLISKITH